MKFSILAISLLTSGSRGFAPGSVHTSSVKSTGQLAFKVAPMITPISQKMKSLQNFELSMAKKEGGDKKSTRQILKSDTPTIRTWKQNADGTITGFISGSPDYKNGESVTTSPIREKKLSAGKIVTTIRGNKYKLQGKGIPVAKEETVRATYSLRKKFSPVKEKAVKPPKGSLFFMSPKNVPILSNWKQNVDGSISGRISGSDEYNENEFVTTSPMKGDPAANKTAITLNGSKYFLEGVGSVLAKPSKTGGTTKTTSVANTKNGADDNSGVNTSVSYYIVMTDNFYVDHFPHHL